jgi:hypothetical protein
VSFEGNVPSNPARPFRSRRVFVWVGVPSRSGVRTPSFRGARPRTGVWTPIEDPERRRTGVSTPTGSPEPASHRQISGPLCLRNGVQVPELASHLPSRRRRTPTSTVRTTSEPAASSRLEGGSRRHSGIEVSNWRPHGRPHQHRDPSSRASPSLEIEPRRRARDSYLRRDVTGTPCPRRFLPAKRDVDATLEAATPDKMRRVHHARGGQRP